MMLTDKCLKDFLDYCYKNHQKSKLAIQGISDIYLNALIIEFFDSVGIYIEIECCMCDRDYGFESGIYFDNYKYYVNAVYFTQTRQESINKAIEKANEIYNETKA